MHLRDSLTRNFPRFHWKVRQNRTMPHGSCGLNSGRCSGVGTENKQFLSFGPQLLVSPIVISSGWEKYIWGFMTNELGSGRPITRKPCSRRSETCNSPAGAHKWRRSRWGLLQGKALLAKRGETLGGPVIETQWCF